MEAPPGRDKSAMYLLISQVAPLLRTKSAGSSAAPGPFFSPPMPGCIGALSIHRSLRIWAAFAQQMPFTPPFGILSIQKSLKPPTAALPGSPPPRSKRRRHSLLEIDRAQHAAPLFSKTCVSRDSCKKFHTRRSKRRRQIQIEEKVNENPPNPFHRAMVSRALGGRGTHRLRSDRLSSGSEEQSLSEPRKGSWSHARSIHQLE